MATFFQHNPEHLTGDGLQTLVLMNPSTYVQYSGEPPMAASSVPSLTGNSVMFLNSVTTSSQHLVGIPLPPGTVSGIGSSSHSMHDGDMSSPYHGFVSRVHCNNFWNPIGSSSEPAALESTTPQSQQGLSLSLSSQQQREVAAAAASRPQPSALSGDQDVRVSSGGLSPAASGVTIGVSGMPSAVLSSKYSKAARDLLDELVSVGHEIMFKEDTNRKLSGGDKKKVSGESNSEGPKAGDDLGGGKSGAELTAAERQEVQMKKTKLMAMLDEVEQRYRQYHHQMQIVIASFEQATGSGSARSYTSLALKTISKQFRCLRDAISRQIKAASRSLGEEESISPRGRLGGGGSSSSSRLKFVDHHFRQQQALQQLGMVPGNSNAWRPQRGLPERAVSVLRAWLFEHFLHPYPKDSDKQMLAKQTGLTRSQVSNWFINARVRLWKPMVEEMYLEETKENQNNEPGLKPSKEESSVQPNRTTPSLSTSTSSGFGLIGSSELDGIAQLGNSKKPRSSQLLGTQVTEFDNKPRTDEPEQLVPQADMGRHDYLMLRGPPNFISGFGQYPIETDMGRFGAETFTAPRFSHNNNVALTLGLPHCENMSIPGAHHHQSFLPELGRLSSLGPNPSGGFEGVDVQNSRKRFAAHQLMPDFAT